MPLRSSEVPGGVISGVDTLATPWEEESRPASAAAGCVRLFLVKYEAERGNCGLDTAPAPPAPVETPVPWNDDLRLTSGDEGAEEAGERWEGGV